MGRIVIMLGFGSLLAALPGIALAQDTDTESTQVDFLQDTDVDQQIDAALKAQEASFQTQLDELKASFEAAERVREEEIDTLRTDLDALIEEREAEMMSAAEADFQPSFRVYGFFDLTFAKNFYDEHSPYNELYTPYSSFMMTGFNLYFASQMTQTLSALAELKFTFLPLGQPTGNQDDEEVFLYFQDGSGQILHFGSSNPVNTSVMDPFTTGTYNLGGVAIERIHLDWKPKDYINVIVGRFLTPYGIWNVDHGSPIILTARLPYMMIREMVPTAQTGVQIFGRFFPKDNLFLDYGITASNGRGALDALMDLDENKGLGLRLGMVYSGKKMKVSLGGYGYIGTYSNKVKIRHIVIAPDGEVIDPDYDGGIEGMNDALEIRMTTLEEYNEYIATADLKLEMFGFLLQSEYVWRRVVYSTPGTLSLNESTFAGVQAEEQDPNYRHASFVGYSVYGLLGYTLPLSIPVKFTPYVMFEYNTSNDTQPYINMKYYIAGLNVKPSPFVTLKLEGNIIDPENEFYGSNMKSLMLQTAVSF